MQPLAAVVAQLEAGDPPAPDAGFLGAELDPHEAALVLLPVPWEATTSYGGGTARAPEAIVTASHQLDLEDPAFDRPYRAGIAMLETHPGIRTLNDEARPAARRQIAACEQGEADRQARNLVNECSADLDQLVYDQACEWLAGDKLVGLIGGDHSCPAGLIAALAEHHPYFGILHFDAHHDLREAYEGFERSHASIMNNVMRDHHEVTRLVSVGIRDYSRAEAETMRALGQRGRCYTAHDLFARQARGEPFAEICAEIIDQLPLYVYVSFDIDALDPPYCPNTGTPVPGGMSYDQAAFLLEELARSGKTIIGFDCCEVAPGDEGDEWDANVAARLIYKLCGATLHSQGLLEAEAEED